MNTTQFGRMLVRMLIYIAGKIIHVPLVLLVHLRRCPVHKLRVMCVTEAQQVVRDQHPVMCNVLIITG